MELTFTGRGLHVDEGMRRAAEHKLARLSRMQPRVTRIDLKFIAEHHPRPDGLTRVEAALRIPRKTFRAHAEAEDVPSALDAVAERLERQLRDHNGRRRARLFRRRDALQSSPAAPPEAADGDGREDGPGT